MTDTVPRPDDESPRLTADERYLLSIIETGSRSHAERLEHLNNLHVRGVIDGAEMLHIRRALEVGW